MQGVLVFVIRKTKGVFVFEIAKTKTHAFTVKFDLKLGGKNRTEDNLLDQTYFGYNLASYFDGFDFRRPSVVFVISKTETDLRSQVLVFEGLSFRSTPVRWLNGDISNSFKFTDFKKNLKLGLRVIGKQYIVWALSRNILTCIYSNTTSTHFQLDPPTVQDYLAYWHHSMIYRFSQG